MSAPAEKICSGCNKPSTKEGFSKAQWKKGAVARCKSCVENGTPVLARKVMPGAEAGKITVLRSPRNKKERTSYLSRGSGRGPAWCASGHASEESRPMRFANTAGRGGGVGFGGLGGGGGEESSPGNKRQMQ